MMRTSLFCFLFLIFSCSSKEDNLTAQKIVDKSISASGVDKLKQSEITFDFRDISYRAIRDFGEFEFSRSFDSIYDVLSNDGFKRFVNGKEFILSDSLANVYSNSVNSVHYFSVLPFNLNDEAVFKQRISDAVVNDENYYRIKVTFSENGGGDDYEDVFIYWINKSSFLIDYIAYSYKTDGGGMRFRALKNEIISKEVHFRNFENYKPKSTIKLEKIDSAYMNNGLEKVSEIILRNIKVQLN